MSTKAEPKHRGTLVCVVLKAKNLPNKRSIGKQDPYCVLQLGTEQHKTKPDKRGGQHPQWDEQLHFEIYDDMEDQLRKQDLESEGNVSLSQATRRKTKAGKSLRVSCYADDNKEPEFIGEGVVDLTDTLRSGEFDEWVTIKAKDRYAGEVYLELTFYSSAAPPKPKKVLKHSVPANTTYGGAGTFSEDFDESEFAPRPPVKANSSHAPIPSSFVQQPHASQRQNGTVLTASQTFSHMSYDRTGASSGIEVVPSSLRPSASIANLDTYTPPYAPPIIQRERSPAPLQAPSNEQHTSLPPSASAQFYGHRLPDAAPASVVAQRMEDEARRHSQQMSSSSTFHNLPQANSTSTIRPVPHHQSSIDDLIRPLSSMSMQTLPTLSEAGQVSSLPGQGSYVQQDPAYRYAQQPQHVDQFGRPLQGPTAAASYSQLPVAHTPPVHPYSAPPATHHADLPQSQSYISGWNNTQQPLQAPPQHPSTMTPSPSIHAEQRRPVSPNPGAAPPPPPPRTHTPSGYQALPPPPASAPPAYPAADGQYDPSYSQQVAYQQPQQPPYTHIPSSSSSIPSVAAYRSSPPKPQSSRPLPQVHHSGAQSQTASPAIVTSQLPPQPHAHAQTPAYESSSGPVHAQWQHGQAAYPPPPRSQSPLPPPPQQPPSQVYAQQPYPGYPPPASPRPVESAGVPVYSNGTQAPHASYEPGHYAVASQSSYPLPSPLHAAHPPPSQYYPPPPGAQGPDQSGIPTPALYERTYAPNPSVQQAPPPTDPTQQYQYTAQQTPHAAHGHVVGPGSYAGAYPTPAPPTYPHPPASYYKTTFANQHTPSPY